MPFRRKNSKKRPDRAQYRADLTGDETILATVISQKGAAPEGTVSNLSIHGAGVQIPLGSDPGLQPGDVLELALRSLTSDWTVQTPARLCQLHESGTGELLLGCEFINLGNLYSQLEDALGTFFNRRGTRRVRPEVEHKIVAQVKAGARRLRSPVYDLSATGLGIAIQRYQKDWTHVGQEVEVEFQLPGIKKELTGPAHVRHFDPLTSDLLVGIEFDLEAPRGMARHAKKLDEYIEQRREAMRQLEKAWVDHIGTSGLEPPRGDMLPPPPGHW